MELGASTELTRGPLTGMRVLEMGSTVAGPFCGRLLADFALSWLRLELRKPIASAPATPAPAATSVTPASALVAPPAYTAVITIERTHEIP